MSKRFSQALSFIVLTMVVVCATSQTVQAGKTLRYQFKQGEQFVYAMDQTMDMKMSIVGQDVEMKMNQKIEMLQKVEAVDSAGVASISQRITRIRMEMTGPPGTAMRYDSAEKKKPEGLVAQIAPLFKTLTKAEFKVKMAPSGELLEVEVPTEFFEKLKETPGMNLLEGMFNKDSFKQMLTQAATTFPTTPVDQGDTWTNSFALDNPLGKQNVETKYSYEGEETVDGKVLDKIGLVIKMNFGKLENPVLAGATVKIKKQDSKGTMYFDNTRGQMASSQIDQNMEMEITVGDNTISQVLKMKINVTITDKK